MSCKCFDSKAALRSKTCFFQRLHASCCHCASRFTVSERKSKFNMRSADLDMVDKFMIDGFYDSDQQHNKCDYLYGYNLPYGLHRVNDHEVTSVALFVELKGTDVEHAARQIDSTIERFYKQGFFRHVDKAYGVIISNGMPSNNATFRKACKEILHKWKRIGLVLVQYPLEASYDPTTDRFYPKGS